MSESSPIAWDEAAATFDLAPDHGLHDGDVRSAWAALLARVVPAAHSRLADLGCGTGSLAILASELGHRVDGVDFSEQMLAMARAKANDADGVTFIQGDAADPGLAERAYDAVICRHVLWALPDPHAAIQTWTRLLRPGGKLVLIEGSWSTGAGLSIDDTSGLIRDLGYTPTIELLDDPRYWGGPITDHRYLATVECT